MAAISSPTSSSDPAAVPGVRSHSAALQALRTAACLLPGLVSPLAQAQDAFVESFSFQLDHVEEQTRDLLDVRSSLDPLRVDVLHSALSARIADALNLRLNVTQDSWSGATPFTTAPLAANGNRAILRNSPTGLIESGASPYANNRVLVDGARHPYRSRAGLLAVQDSRVVHILSSASPEIRQQGDVTLAYEGLNHGLEVGGSISDEPDFLSRFGSAALRLDFRQKTTNVKVGVSYTDNDIQATLDSDVLPYLTREAFREHLSRKDGEEVLRAGSHEWSLRAGLTQVLNRQAVVDFSLAYSVSAGYLATPYKATTVLFVDPALQGPDPQALLSADMRVLMEQRPQTRRQLGLNARLVHYWEPLDAALHLSVQAGRDSWQVNTFAAEAQWVQPLGRAWTVTPRLRVYSQTDARFYTPYLVSEQAYRRVIFENETPHIIGFDPARLPRYFASDHRLAGFGSVSASLTASREITRGLRLEASVERYQRRQDWQWQGAGAGDFSDLGFTLVSAGLTLDFAAASARSPRPALPLAEHAQHGTGMAMPMSQDHAHAMPPGLMFAHLLPAAGQMMLGYRVQNALQSGAMRERGGRVGDAEILSSACAPDLCRYVPRDMRMQMHMLEWMVAPRDWLTLMLMPQMMSMEMHFRELAGRPPAAPGEHEHATGTGHRSGGLGDTLVAALLRMPDGRFPGWHVGMGLSVPTGKVDLTLRRMFKTDGGLMHFDMQTGSGTWDLLPSVTYSAGAGSLSYGAQWTGIARLGARNDSGYRLGNQQQLTGWLARTISPRLSVSARGVYTHRERVKGDFTAYNARLGPMDLPDNQGGTQVDLGVGATYTFQAGGLKGSQLALEWTTPLVDKPYGAQLSREPALSASWQTAF